MNFMYNFKNLDASDHLKDYARKRFSKLSKYLGDSENARLQVNLAVEKHRQTAEVIMHGDDVHIFAFEESHDMYATIDKALDKLESQLRKKRDRVKGGKQKAAKQAPASVSTEFFELVANKEGGRVRTIVESDSYQPKPMSVEEAVEQLDTLPSEFLVFQNSESERINVVYRRKNSVYGLIDPGF